MFVRLFNITVLGSESKGQSAVTIQNSSLVIADSTFIGIYGYIGAALEIFDSSVVIFTGHNFFKNNKAKFGGAVYSAESILILNGTNLFMNDSGTTYGGGMEAILSYVTFAGTALFVGNYAIMGASVFSIDSKLTMKGNAKFELNFGYFGTGIALIGTSKLVLIPPTNLIFIQNYVKIAGAALFIKDDNCPAQSLVPPSCFLSMSNFASRANTLLYFEDNIAGKTGNVLYGGLMNMCRLCYISGNKQQRSVSDLQ